jgi:hypothetical protein
MSKEEMQGQLIETPKSDELREYKMLIGGEWVDARSGKTFESINPYMGKVWARVRRRATHPLRKAISGKRVVSIRRLAEYTKKNSCKRGFLQCAQQDSNLRPSDS